jgi:serine protease AprX
MLVNAAKIIPGEYVPAEVGPPPDFSDGFGRVDLAATIGPYAAGETVVFKDENTALDTGQQEQTIQTIGTAGQTLKVTLAWTDPSGEALQNDLDLVIQAGGQEQHGNVALGSVDFDRTNNVEEVIWPNLPQGDATIIVRGFRITTPQTYALVVRVS